MLVVPKAIADKPQAVTFYNMMDYKPNALLGIIIAITMIIFGTLIILMLVVGWPNRKHLVGRSSMIVDNYSCLAA